MTAEKQIGRRALAVAGVVLILLLIAGAAVPGDEDAVLEGPAQAIEPLLERSQVAVNCPLSEGRFGPGNWPSACWRPYSDESPFNRPIGPSPRVTADSDRVVERLLGFGPLQNMLVGEAGKARDYSHPTYWSQPGDPWFTLRCTKPWGTCQVEGMRIQIPDEARVPTGSDGHMTVVNQTTGWEYDFWQVKDKPKGGGTLSFSWGGRTEIGGPGIEVDANAANFGELAGLIRAEELEAGRIDHALFIFVNCDSGRYVYPATHVGRSCESIGLPNDFAPPEGARFQLAMSYDEIEALDVPDWKKTILHAMAEYGMYVGDTGGMWGLKLEGGITYTSFGYEDKYVRFAKEQGVPYDAKSDRWVFNLRDGVDWRGRLRVIDPCESAGTC